MNPETSLRRPPLSYRMMQAVLCPVLSALGLCCRSAFRLCNERMNRRLSWVESVMLRVHLTVCAPCSHVSKQFKGLRKLVQAAHHEDHDGDSPESLSEEARTRIAGHLDGIR